MLVRDARVEFDIEFEVWRTRQTSLRSGGASAAASAVTPDPTELTDKERKQRWRRQLIEYENKFDRKRPRPMTHLQFRISVINSLVKRRLLVDLTSARVPRDVFVLM